MKKKIIGYTQGTFDTLHFGHIRLLKNAKKMCDYLIVGVNSDDLVREYKQTETILKEDERKEIVSSIKYVDEASIVFSLNKVTQWNNFHFDFIFIGDDWKGNERWKNTEEEMKKLGVDVIYLPHTEGISTTLIKSKMKK